MAGCANWLLIGILQYDYIAGFFGFQASIMSRIFYVLFGIGSLYLLLRVIINKGTFKIFERKKKKQKEEKEEIEKSFSPKENAKAMPNIEYAHANIEASKEQTPPLHIIDTPMPTSNETPPHVDFDKLKEYSIKNENTNIPTDNSEHILLRNLEGKNTVWPQPSQQVNPNNDNLFDEHIRQGK